MRHLVFASILLAGISGCAGSQWADLARSGRSGELASQIAERQQRGALTKEELREVARGTLLRSVEKLDANSAPAFFGVADRCVGRLEGSIRSKIDHHDGAHDAALFALATHDLLSNREAAGNRAIDATVRRAIAARSLVRSSDAAARREALQNASVMVREQALQASIRAADEGDLELLLERVRLDPDLALRMRALDAARTAARRLREAALPGFVERFEDAVARDAALEDAVARTLAMTPFYEHGGRRTLETWIGGTSSRSVHASTALLFAPNRSASADTSLRASALSVLKETLKSEDDARLLDAVRSLPPLDAFAEELSRRRDHASPTVRANVLSQMLRSAQFETEAVRQLLMLAADADHPEAKAVATFALVSRRDMRLVPLLERDLLSPLPGRRIAAGRALTQLGYPSRGASLLTDRDPSVRNAFACELLADDAPNTR